MKEERPTEEEASDGSSCDEAVHEPGDPARETVVRFKLVPSPIDSRASTHFSSPSAMTALSSISLAVPRKVLFPGSLVTGV